MPGPYTPGDLRGVGAGILAFLLLATAARAAMEVRSVSVLEVEVTAPPLTFSEGAGAARSRFVDVTVSANATGFDATVVGRIGADSSTRDVVRLANAGAGSRDVTLRGTQVSNANVLIYTWTVRDGPTTLATLDLRAGTPSASFSVPAGGEVELDLRIKLVKNADQGASGSSSSVWAVVP